MARSSLLALPDYQRIYQVTHSVLEASEIAITHRACIFFASVGALIMRDHYSLPATISAGCMALMVDEQKANVVVYERDEGGAFVNDKEAFHAWVECEGWLIDFMSPIKGVALRDLTEPSLPVCHALLQHAARHESTRVACAHRLCRTVPGTSVFGSSTSLISIDPALWDGRNMADPCVGGCRCMRTAG
jgi:hypothetical protein